MAKDLTAKIRAVELALARGANILDAVMSRKHDRETELDSRCRDMYIQQHEVCVKMYRHFYQMLCDKEDKRDQLVEHMEQLKHQFESAVKIANFSEIGRIKELMKRVDSDLIRIQKEIEEGFHLMFARFKACWELERVLYQRFRLAESSIGDDPNLELLSEDPSLVPLKLDPSMSTTTWKPRPSALEPFLVMRMDANVVKNPQFKEGRTAWACNEATELSLRESADHERGPLHLVRAGRAGPAARNRHQQRDGVPLQRAQRHEQLGEGALPLRRAAGRARLGQVAFSPRAGHDADPIITFVRLSIPRLSHEIRFNSTLNRSHYPAQFTCFNKLA